MEYFLIDNGSLRPESVLQIRKIAEQLSRSSGHMVCPFGLMHSHKIDRVKLEDNPGRSMQEFLPSTEADELEEIRALPFFLGPSLAITDWLPENLKLWKDKNPDQRKFRILKPLYQSGDDRLARAMAELCREQIQNVGLINPAVAMVDHGTPLPEVNQVREDVGAQMKQLLGTEIGTFSTCAMERRPDPQYDFNNPLLEDLLEEWMEEGVQEVVLSQFFLLPGRHAGPGGDLAQICHSFIDRGMKIYRTENVGAHSLVHEILLDRIRADQNH
jgi:sirohydrochlorin ferrochelatase